MGEPPTSADTVARSKETAAAFAKAVAAGDSTTIRSLLHQNVMFYDTAQKHPQLGASAAVDWFASTKPVTVRDAQNAPLIVGRGWAVARWTATGADAATSGIIVPGATVMEIRGGKVVRLTVYSDSTKLPLHD